ncbi:response regulator transcription factor [Accumulibacter sp.]|uniref:response regulator transcription factor n=1 Tax=Accumulibacter sp. TaxID=2053492 RepID=UPI0035AE4B83
MSASNAVASAGAKVLIVDDHELTRALLRSILRSNDYEVVGEARDGIGALELAERLRPDIICMDVVMPEMGGLEALQAIKALHPQIVVIMVSGTPSVANVRDSIQGGASGFIIKPYKVGKVLDTLRLAWPAAGKTLPDRHNSNLETT